MKRLKENVHDIQVGCQTCRGPHLDKECPLNEEVKNIEEVKYDEFGCSSPFNNGAKYREEDTVPTKVLPCQLPLKELNPGGFTLPCTIGSLNFYAMADLGASVNVIPKSMFKHLKLDNLKKIDMLVEMADMTKRAPIGIMENVLVKIDKF
ncbi:phospholipase-like protein [Tanacetum coccineum]